MNRQQALDILRGHRDALRSRGVVHAALFGSVARGEEGPDSDIDVFIELAPDVVLDIFEYVGLKTYIEDLFPGPVDVVDRAALKSFATP